MTKPSEELKNQVEEIINEKVERLFIILFVSIIIFILCFACYKLGYNNGLLFNLENL